MSQNFLTVTGVAGVELSIFFGYDRPLNYFFLSIEPKQRADVPRKELYYESMYDPQLRGGFGSTDGLLNKLFTFVDAKNVPRGLAHALRADEIAENDNFRNRTINNVRRRWPLPADEQQLLDIQVDVEVIDGMLANDEHSTDDELLEVMLESVVVLKHRDILAQLIKRERPSYFTDATHEVYWAFYFAGLYPCWA